MTCFIMLFHDDYHLFKKDIEACGFVISKAAKKRCHYSFIYYGIACVITEICSNEKCTVIISL